MRNRSNNFSLIALFFTASIFLFGSNACSVLSSKEGYKQGQHSNDANRNQSLALPENVKINNVEDYYPLPQINQPQMGNKGKDSIVPPGSLIEKKDAEKVAKKMQANQRKK